MLFCIAIELHDDGLQHAALAAVNLLHDAGTWRCEDNARITFVAKQRLTEPNPVAFTNLHAGLESHAVVAQYGNRTYGVTGMHALLRRAGERYVQPSFYFYSQFSLPEQTPSQMWIKRST